MWIRKNYYGLLQELAQLSRLHQSCKSPTSSQGNAAPGRRFMISTDHGNILRKKEENSLFAQ